MKVETKAVGRKRIRRDQLLTLDHVKVERADYSGQRLKKLTVIGSAFVHCSFEDMKIDDAGFGSGGAESTYFDCSFDRARIRWFNPGFTRYERCSFRDASIDELFSYSAEFVDCSFSGSIKKGLFWGRSPQLEAHRDRRTPNEFLRNDFRDADLRDVGFRGGIDPTKQLLPDSPHHLFIRSGEIALRATREIVLSWKDMEARRRAISILAALEVELQSGQEQLFTRPDTFFGPRGRNAEIATAVFDLLRQNNRPQ